MKNKPNIVTSFNDKDTKLSDRLFNSASDLKGFEPRGIGPVDNSDHVGGNYLASLRKSSMMLKLKLGILI